MSVWAELKQEMEKNPAVREEVMAGLCELLREAISRNALPELLLGGCVPAQVEQVQVALPPIYYSDSYDRSECSVEIVVPKGEPAESFSINVRVPERFGSRIICSYAKDSMEESLTLVRDWYTFNIEANRRESALACRKKRAG